ncbi:hypothetical protein SAMN06893097_104219 [Geodermatophilus sabuli]|uniref:Uncharacterized protein n=1 Tax=Geodermatophilus sabuli TaxID=1564158 RepID=A0A285EE82_9ACTN|nr:hypothetical protein SAMN06893097_104219 [Geodermatophilus sabuli]
MALCGELGDDGPVGLELIGRDRPGAVPGQVHPDGAGILPVLEHRQLEGHHVDDRGRCP